MRTQVELQAYQVSNANLEAITDDERATLLGTRDTPPEVTSWGLEIPLVLVSTYYEPVGPLSRPVGVPDPETGAADSNLIWLDPMDEVAFVRAWLPPAW